MAVTLGAETIFSMFEEMSAYMKQRRTRGRIYVFGGAAMLMAYGRSVKTEDVDVQIDEGHGAITEAARVIGRRRGLEDNWLNEEGVPCLPTSRKHDGEVVFDGEGLKVVRASPQMMLALKIEAGREKDEKDTQLLMRRLGVTTTEQAEDIHREVFRGMQVKHRTAWIAGLLKEMNEGETGPRQGRVGTGETPEARCMIALDNALRSRTAYRDGAIARVEGWTRKYRESRHIPTEKEIRRLYDAVSAEDGGGWPSDPGVDQGLREAVKHARTAETRKRKEQKSTRSEAIEKNRHEAGRQEPGTTRASAEVQTPTQREIEEAERYLLGHGERPSLDAIIDKIATERLDGSRPAAPSATEREIDIYLRLKPYTRERPENEKQWKLDRENRSPVRSDAAAQVAARSVAQTLDGYQRKQYGQDEDGAPHGPPGTGNFFALSAKGQERKRAKHIAQTIDRWRTTTAPNLVREIRETIIPLEVGFRRQLAEDREREQHEIEARVRQRTQGAAHQTSHGIDRNEWSRN